MTDSLTDPAAIIALLGLQPHPEGGHYVETYRAPTTDGARAAVTMIYFLLRAGEVSHWHKVDAVEIWNWYAGAPLSLCKWQENQETIAENILGHELHLGQRPQAVVPKDAWQSARSLGAWTLVGCSVSPGFDFAGFVLAPAGWAPPTGS